MDPLIDMEVNRNTQHVAYTTSGTDGSHLEGGNEMLMAPKGYSSEGFDMMTGGHLGTMHVNGENNETKQDDAITTSFIG